MQNEQIHALLQKLVQQHFDETKVMVGSVEFRWAVQLGGNARVIETVVSSTKQGGWVAVTKEF